ncbi:hypothetical protein A2U01_0052716, partial [Trifolium medium]|nr:hypothetical protein [Trifolium medium]
APTRSCTCRCSDAQVNEVQKQGFSEIDRMYLTPLYE